MLSPKKELWVQEYLKDLNATQACIRAGYSEKGARKQGNRMLADVGIQERIRELQAVTAAATGVEVKALVQELAKIAYTDLSDVVELAEGKLKVKDFSELSEAQRAALAEVSETKGRHGATTRVKLNSKLQAIDMLMRHLGGYVTPATLIDSLPPERLQELCDQILAKLRA